MIIQGILNVLYTVLNTVLFFELPTLPDGAMEYLGTVFDYMASAVGILANWTPMPYLLALLTLIIAVDAARIIWEFAIWVYRKIPGGQS